MPPRRRPNEVNGKSPAPPAATSRTPKAASTKASKASSKAGIKARGTGKAHKLAPPLPCGEILTDLKKKQWKIGEGIGQGGFGLIYLASDDVEHSVGREAEYVMKVEPVSNGPLFCELHFYQRAAKPEYIEEFTKSKKLKYLGVPKFITTGQHSYNGQEYRFLVMQRFGTDLQKLFESSGKRFPRKTICCIGLRMLDALEYMHSHEYVHADLKAANLLLGCKKGVVNTNEVYLVDFGLAFRYDVEGRLKEYKEDPRRAHDGTIEFTSIDAHNGVAPGRRGDLEILGYCLLQWHAGSLPWEKNLNNKEYVRKSKIEYMSNIDSLMSACFPSGDHPAEIKEYLKYVSKLDYQQTPNYNTLRTILRSGFPAGKKGAEWTLEFDAASSSQSPKKGTKRKSSENDLPAAAPRGKTKKKSAPCVVESLTPAMKERMAKITAASSSSAGSIGTGRRLVKRSKAVKTDIAIQTSPAQGRKKKP